MSEVRNFDLNLLVALKLLLEERSVSRAAEKMFVSPSAMSHILQRLRQQLNDPLLMRTSKGMEPTEKALSLLDPISNILGEVATIINKQSKFVAATSERRFVIATNDYVDFIIFPPLIEATNKLAPNIQIHVKPTRSAVPYTAIDKNSVDLVIGFRDLLNPHPYVRQATIMSDKFMCLVRNDHPIITGTSISFEQFISGSHMVTSSHETGFGLIDSHLKELGVKRKVSLIVPNVLSVPRILANTDLVFSVPLTLAEHFVQLAPLKMMPFPMNCPELDLIMVWHPLQEKESAHEWLRQQILGTCHKLTG